MKKNYIEVNGIKIHWGFKLLPSGFEAITLFGHVFDTRDEYDLKVFLKTMGGKMMVNHERIHIMQAKSFKLKYFTFYLLYLFFWFIGLFKYGADSYWRIPFEREAYDNENNKDYTTTYWKYYCAGWLK